ncbi:winged helix-turn-helix transcriptional regulator [Candidatus Pacearchaeota archaeon]|nr:winged helix-turn-helix transcriptional regulator [Candidatus Pacearchaeota archaeon]
MENKKLGIVLIAISLIVGGFFIYFINLLSKQALETGCLNNSGCFAIERGLSISHAAIGVFSFMLALGFYLLFFNKTEKAILKKLEDEKNKKIEDSKLEYILKALDPYEKKVIIAAKEQEGITQNTLRLRTDMSKAKLSYVLQELERRGIIKRIPKGKTLAVYLKI